jgi:regulation of enolase protein 1 (concanavalin A-like superfamily)
MVSMASMVSTPKRVTSSTRQENSTSDWMTKEAHDDHGAVTFRLAKKSENVRILNETR